MHAPYDLTWPLHFRCFLSVFVLQLLRQLPAACLLTCLFACKLYTIYLFAPWGNPNKKLILWKRPLQLQANMFITFKRIRSFAYMYYYSSFLFNKLDLGKQNLNERSSEEIK